MVWLQLGLAIVCAACGRIGFDLGDDATVPCPVTWTWTGDEVASWTIAHLDLAGTSVDACGCPQMPSACTCGAPSACVDNTVKSTASGIATFDSGPLANGGICHRNDGFIARRAGVPVRAGVVHHLTIDVTGLAAQIVGLVGAETADGFRPSWTLFVFEGSTGIATLGPISWATPQCLTCATTAADLGSRELRFTPSTTEVELVLYAKHQSSQCCAEAHGIRLQIDDIIVVADTGTCVVP